MRAFATAALKIVGLLVAFLIAISATVLLESAYQLSVPILTGLALVGAFFLFTRRSSVIWKTAGWLCIAFAAIQGITMVNQYHQLQVEKDRARKVEEARQEQAKAERARLEAEERAERRRKELEEVTALRKTNVTEYLARLKPLDEAKWLEELKALRPREHAALVAEEKQRAARQAESEERERQRRSPKSYLTMDMGNWYLGGFGTVMIVNFTIKSTLQFPVQDFTIRCVGTGNSGTQIASAEKTIFDTIPAKATKRFNEVNMGLVNSQTARARCDLVSVKL